MDVNWDPEKAESNLKKHGIRFSDAETILSDPNALTREDVDSEGKQRFVTVGMDVFSAIQKPTGYAGGYVLTAVP